MLFVAVVALFSSLSFFQTSRVLTCVLFMLPSLFYPYLPLSL